MLTKVDLAEQNDANPSRVGIVFNLLPMAFLRQGEGGREKTLASADHVIFTHSEKLGLIK